MSDTNLAPFHGRMSESAYRQERDLLRATYGETAPERTGLYEQALAKLFYRSGWTQQELAKVEGKKQTWVVYRLRFGRFLAFITAVIIPKSFGEWKFRKYWERTDKTETNERIRFRAVERLMQDELTVSKDRSPMKDRPIAEAILATSADGNWHRLAIIVARVKANVAEADEENVEAVLERMRRRGIFNTFCARRKGGVSWSYRIVRGRGLKVDLAVLRQELEPIIQGFEAEGKKNMATMSPGTVRMLTHQLKTIIERLARQGSSPTTRSEESDNGDVSVD